MPRLSQRLEQKQKLAPRQVLQARLLQLNTINLEQTILKELELNPILEQVEPEEILDESVRASSLLLTNDTEDFDNLANHFDDMLNLQNKGKVK